MSLNKKNEQMKLLICDITSDQQCTFLSVVLYSRDKEYMKLVICRYKEVNRFLYFFLHHFIITGF